MFHIALFGLLSLGAALFAFAAAGANQYLIAIPAAILALWFGDVARGSFLRWKLQRTQRHALASVASPYSDSQRETLPKP